MFFDMSKYMHYKSLLNALSIEIKLPYKISSNKINVTKNALFFTFASFKFTVLHLICDSCMS